MVDGISVIDDTQAIFEPGRQHAVPFMAGYNSFEGNLTPIFPWTYDFDYDPLRLPSSVDANNLDLTVQDAKRNREIPMRV